jgi:RNA polymerase sigma-70 factor, ECF subfamily
MPDPGDGHPTDRDLLDRATQGDLEALTEIYHRYQKTVFRFAQAMTGSPDAAEDITQEVFVALMTDAARYDPSHAAFTTYLYGIVRNLSRARLRRVSRLLPIDMVSLLASDPAVGVHPLNRLEDEQKAAAVRKALAKLPSRYRELIILCDLHGQSYADAAAIVRTSVAAVRSRLHRGRQLLRLRLQRIVHERPRGELKPMRWAI